MFLLENQGNIINFDGSKSVWSKALCLSKPWTDMSAYALVSSV